MFAFAGGGGGIYVSEIVKGGVADKCGRLARGDEIIAVNEISLKRATQVPIFIQATHSRMLSCTKKLLLYCLILRTLTERTARALHHDSIATHELQVVAEQRTATAARHSNYDIKISDWSLI